MNRASHLQVVLDIIDTVYLLKCALIMGGLVITLATGILLTNRLGLPYFVISGSQGWLGVSQLLAVIIAVNSVVLLYLMTLGRSGHRSYFRYVPAVGYNNIALISLVFIQMTVKPSGSEQAYAIGLPLFLLIAADVAYIRSRVKAARHLLEMSPQEFSTNYFRLLKEENMTEFFRLFRDDAEFYDPFALGPVIGIRAIQDFFQKLGDQFEEIDIQPTSITGDRDTISTEWVAKGVTKNGAIMAGLTGSNVMRRVSGKIKSIHIEFDLAKLPPISRVPV